MPELPEVETIRHDLEKMIEGKKIAQVEVLTKSIVEPNNFSKIVVGKKIITVSRRAKLLMLKLSDNWQLLIHLKMTGQLIYRLGRGEVAAVGGHPIALSLQVLPNKFTRVVFTLNDQSKLFFNDIRKFGYLKAVRNSVAEKIKIQYGIEPLTKEFTLKNFSKVLTRRPKMKVKQFLLAQELIAGLGNIYSDEACFYAGVKPTRTTSSLHPVEIKKLFSAISQVLKKSLKYRGTSSENYVDASGRSGGFVPHLMVYGRAGEKCKKCDKNLIKIKLGGRTSVYCPHCQK